MRTTIVKSAARVLDLLELLSASSRPLGVTEIASRLDIPKSSAFALISTLVIKDYAEEAEGGFRIAARLHDRGWVGGDIAQLLRISRSVMTALMQSSGESIFLGILTNERDVLYLEKVICTNPIRYDTDIEQIRAAYCTSIGQVLLSDLPKEELDRYLATTNLEPKTPSTETHPERIREIIEQARGCGYVHTLDSHFEGVAGVAAPIRGPNGHVLAGIAIIGPSWRFLPVLDAQTDRVQEAAAKISAMLSGSSERPTHREAGTRPIQVGLS